MCNCFLGNAENFIFDPKCKPSDTPDCDWHVSKHKSDILYNMKIGLCDLMFRQINIWPMSEGQRGQHITLRTWNLKYYKPYLWRRMKRSYWPYCKPYTRRCSRQEPGCPHVTLLGVWQLGCPSRHRVVHSGVVIRVENTDKQPRKVRRRKVPHSDFNKCGPITLHHHYFTPFSSIFPPFDKEQEPQNLSGYQSAAKSQRNLGEVGHRKYAFIII